MHDTKITRNNFNKATETYDAAAILSTEVAKRLGERLDYIKIQPHTVVDVGSGTGIISKHLLKRYPKATIVSLDFAINMAKQSRKQGSWLRKPKAICADAEKLPLKSDSTELLISNLMLHWVNDIDKTFLGFHTALAPNGLLLFTLFGPDTLKEIRESWQTVDDYSHVGIFPDMHEVGDALLKSGFINPVTDMEIITMSYKNIHQLLTDIQDCGATNTSIHRNKGLTGKRKYQAFEKAYDQYKTDEGDYPVTFEIIYGHAWVGEGIKFDDFETVIPIHSATCVK